MIRVLVSGLLIGAFCLGAAVGYFNWTPVSFDYLAGQAELPLIALLLAAFLLGVLVAWLLNLGRFWLLNRDNRRLRRQVGGLEAELKNLRNLPLAPPPPAPTAPTPVKNA